MVNWLARPLCHRYAAAVFSRIQLRGSTAKSQAVCWVVGSSIDGEAEVLGAWSAVPGPWVASEMIFSALQARGTEFIRFCIGNPTGMGHQFTGAFERSEFVASVEQVLQSIQSQVPPRDRLEVSRHLRPAADAENLEAARSELAKFQASRLGERYPEVVQHWSDALAGFVPIYGLHPQLRELVRSADRTAAEVRERLTRAILRHGPFVDADAALDFVAGTLLRTEQSLDRERARALAARHAAQACVPAAPATRCLAVSTLA